MAYDHQVWLLCALIQLLATSIHIMQAYDVSIENGVKSAVILSPKFVLRPGSVVNKYYYNVDFPRGHIALKSFNAEVIDEAGSPVSLQETYLHHWLLQRYYLRKGVEVSRNDGNLSSHHSDFIIVRNTGVCDDVLGQYFGLGSETRRTATHVPDPYGIEIGNPAEVPEGYEEGWLINVHAIDTRDVENRFGCTECWCNLYNVTKDEYGKPLPPNYVGGFECCYDMTQCRLREGFGGFERGLYLRYTVKWVDWNYSILPVRIYIFDVTDVVKRSGQATRHDCRIEYEVKACASGVNNGGCIDTKRVSLTMPTGGDVIYGVAHQHRGGIGAALYGEDGRIICSSIPTYGKGKEAGNEAGYIVGMSTCYPQPGSVKISDGEILTVESNYSSAQSHTGVMGLFYILVADNSSKNKPLLHTPVDGYEEMRIPFSIWGILLFGVVIAVAVAVVAYRQRSGRDEGYQSIPM